MLVYSQKKAFPYNPMPGFRRETLVRLRWCAELSEPTSLAFVISM